MVKPDKRFWTTIFEDHNPALLGKARSVLGSEPQAVVGISADDVAQQVLAEIMETGLPYVGSHYQVRSFLQRREGWVLSSVFDEAKRRRGGQIEEELPDDRAGPELTTNPIEEVEERLDDDQAVRDERAHFACLTPNQRRVMVEHVEKARPAKDVAAEMGLTDRWVRELAHQAAAKIRQCLKEKGHA
jgi:DNA-directed RNA polymerase specialized sigma24 family protein